MALVESILIEIAKTLVTELGNNVYQELAFAGGLKTQIQKLQNTMHSINALLRDAEAAPPNSTSHSDQVWFEKLSDAVYEADDLFDEITTIAERKKLMGGNAFKNEVRLFFSSSNQLTSCFKLAQRVKSIRETLADISSDRGDFRNPNPPVVRVAVNGRENDVIVGGVSRGTCSYVDHNGIVGRDVDKNFIINKLLDLKDEDVISVIPIVGIGGLGKTTLAQLVFNDEVVRKNFDLMLWVSVPHKSTMKEVIENIIASATGGEKPSNFNLEQLIIHLSRHITGMKYMLVLDDVWDENPRTWQDLKPLLTRGASHGTKILVTTRSLMVCRIMGTIPPYELQPLSHDESSSLFEKIAFQKEGHHDLGVKELVRQILGLCKYVPLVIRVIAGVLATKFTVHEWSSFIDNELSNLELYDDNIMPILKLSYDDLNPKLKACFSYCSLFPRGKEIDKSKLVSLWIAQGFIDPPRSSSHSLEDVGEEYLYDLLNKSLLQEDGYQGTCKLHDLIYDLCCSVAGAQCQMVSSVDSSCSMSNRHISIGYQVDSSWKIPTSLQNNKQLRTFLFTERPCYDTEMSMPVCEGLISRFRCLRALDLHNLGIRNLPKSLGKLIHLRYLDLSYNGSLRELPDSVTLLHNLQYLDLRRCNGEFIIPRDLKNLVNLRHFWLPDYYNCHLYFPSIIGNLTNLQTLNVFCIGKYNTFVQGQNRPTFGRLSDLCHLNNMKGEVSKYYAFCQGRNKSIGSRLSDLCHLNCLKGGLAIFIRSPYKNAFLDAGEANLKAKKNLETLDLIFLGDIDAEEDEMVLEKLQPHENLSNLSIQKYLGVKFPRWMAMNQLASSLPHLASIEISQCNNVQQLPSFVHLPHLKSLSLMFLDGVEYIESAEYEACSCSSSIFFPSLTKLEIAYLKQLKGWSRSSTKVENLSFPRVYEMRICGVPDLKSMPSCPNVESLSLGQNLNQNLEILKPPPPTANDSSSWVPKLKSLTVWDLKGLASLPREYVQQVIQLQGNNFHDNTTEEYLKAFEGLTSIQSLEFCHGKGLMPLSFIAHQLGTLEKMKLSDCKFDYENYLYDSWKLLKSLRSVVISDLLARTEVDVEGPLKGLQHVTALQSLELRKCYRLEAIPEAIGNLSSLFKLEIYECPELGSLPEEMQRLTNLKLLVVDNCPKLAPKCQRDTGEEWPKIQHIPDVIIMV